MLMLLMTSPCPASRSTPWGPSHRWPYRTLGSSLASTTPPTR
uniref:Uncharacterized protein n=1 Tax=Arundo donax TaxID=35708 RepID=A0A0A8XW60_ARUDO